MENKLNYGSYSVVLGTNFYTNFLPFKSEKIVKITKIIPNHNEYKNLKIIRLVDNYEKYYCIPEEIQYIIHSEDKNYNYIKSLFAGKINIFDGNLSCSYINYGGDKDLFETILDIIDTDDFTYWTSYQKILNFTKFILEGLMFLHKKHICHLDIKPENIIVDTYKNTYKIIDFGFCDKEPFNYFVSNFRGTPGYFPRYYQEQKQEMCKYLPVITANDTIKVNGKIPLIYNRKLIYKVDSYCLGRVLYFLTTAYNEKVIYMCINFEKRKETKIREIISLLIHDNVYNRISIEECYNKYFT